MEDRFTRFSLAISEIYRYWHKIAGEEMEKYGLRGPHCIYLTAMSRFPDGATATKLGEFCGKDKSDVSRMMAMMEKKGLVTRRSPNQNLYRGLYRLTEQGKEAAEFVRRRAQIAADLAGKDLTEEKRAVFYECLESIAANIRTLSQKGLPEKHPGEE